MDVTVRIWYKTCYIPPSRFFLISQTESQDDNWKSNSEKQIAEVGRQRIENPRKHKRLGEKARRKMGV